MKNTKRTLLLLFFLIIGINRASAQAGYEDVVYLKNGTVIHGIIIEQIPNVSVKIQTKSKDVFVFKMEEIEKLTKEKKVTNGGGRKEKEPESTDIKKDPYTGYVLTIESQIGESVNTGDNQRQVVGTHIVNGVMFNNMFSVGVGIGFDYINSSNNYYSNNGNNYYYNHDYLAMPYTIDLRAHPIKGKISPLVIVEFGYGVAMFTSHVRGGFLFNGGLGAKLNITRKLGLNMSINYRAQQFNFSEDVSSYTYVNGQYVYNNSYNSGSFTLQHICLTFGITL